MSGRYSAGCTTGSDRGSSRWKKDLPDDEAVISFYRKQKKRSRNDGYDPGNLQARIDRCRQIEPADEETVKGTSFGDGGRCLPEKRDAEYRKEQITQRK